MQRNQMSTMVLALLIMVLACSPLSSCAARSSPELEVQREEAWGFRRFLGAKASNPNQDCSNKFPKLNYKPVTSVCKPKVPATKTCCAAFNKFACQYRSQVNNFNSICPILFMSYLNYAGGYQDGYFIGKCIDGKKGLVSRKARPLVQSGRRSVPERSERNHAANTTESEAIQARLGRGAAFVRFAAAAPLLHVPECRPLGHLLLLTYADYQSELQKIEARYKKERESLSERLRRESERRTEILKKELPEASNSVGSVTDAKIKQIVLEEIQKAVRELRGADKLTYLLETLDKKELEVVYAHHNQKVEESGEEVDLENPCLPQPYEEIKRLLKIEENPVYSKAQQEWTRKAILFSGRVERKKKKVANLKNEIYQLIGFFSVFQGVVLTAVSQSNLLHCNNRWSPICLSVLASIVSVGGVGQKLKQILEFQRTIDSEYADYTTACLRDSRLRELGTEEFEFASLPETKEIKDPTVSLLARIKSLPIYFYLVIASLVAFGVLFPVSHWRILCSPGRNPYQAPAPTG